MQHENFNELYKMLLKELNRKGVKSVTRKGETITELFDQKFTVNHSMKCLAVCRDLSLDYLESEFKFYLGGSNKLVDAMQCSKFWEKCSDDGVTINSNYGKLLLHDKNSKGVTQFQHAVNCLKNNPQSKKAVMTIYSAEHAYISNDNPCTMFLRARIDNEQALHLTAYMRSSDIYFGLPYDVPFFCFIQYALCATLRTHYPGLRLGSYTHIAASLHKYARNEAQLDKAVSQEPVMYTREDFEFFHALCQSHFNHYNKLFCGEHLLVDTASGKIDVNKGSREKEMTVLKDSTPDNKFQPNPFMQEAWNVASKAKCLKKHVGAILTINGAGTPEETIVNGFFGGVNGAPCLTCVRDLDDDKYYGDECPSVHGEMRCIHHAMKVAKITDFSSCTLYVTHGPCDACLKLCDLVGIKKVVYDKPYKTNYAHWPNVEVVQIDEENRRRYRLNEEC